MEVQHTTNEKNGRFFLEEDGQEIAFMTYVFAGDDKFIIDHTVVNPDQEGKGLGKKLVKAGVEFAREKGYKIIPLCPYAKSVIEKTTEYHDILVK